MTPGSAPGRRIREWDQFRGCVGLARLDESVHIAARSELAQQLGQLDLLGSGRVPQTAPRAQPIDG
jgi:hypothetical protein